jgi:splicing factor 3A subunit 2
MKNHLGTYECKLCLTLHTNEGSYLAHTQGKKHQQNLARRAAKLAKDKIVAPVDVKKTTVKKVVKIGRPGYKVSGMCTTVAALIASLSLSLRHFSL